MHEAPSGSFSQAEEHHALRNKSDDLESKSADGQQRHDGQVSAHNDSVSGGGATSLSVTGSSLTAGDEGTSTSNQRNSALVLVAQAAHRLNAISAQGSGWGCSRLEIRDSAFVSCVHSPT